MVPEQRVLRIAKIGRGAGRQRPAVRQGNRRLLQRQPRATMRRRTPARSRRPWRPTRQPPTRSSSALRSGQSFAAAAAPAGFSAAGHRRSEPQTREQFTSVAGARVAGAAFGAAEGAVVGPIQSENGWHVVRIDRIQREGGKTVAEARTEISAKLVVDKRKAAIENIVEHGPGRDRRRGKLHRSGGCGQACHRRDSAGDGRRSRRAPIPATRFRRNWPQR